MCKNVSTDQAPDVLTLKWGLDHCCLGKYIVRKNQAN